MATKRPSFLKRQKEQKRNARAAEKREVRKQRKQVKSESDKTEDFTGTGEVTVDTEVPVP
jgi:hypothetical protein